MKFLFWLSVVGVIYAYVGYPLLLNVINRMSRRDVNEDGRLNQFKNDYEPDISIIMPVYNEENNIEKKLDNLYQLDYPRDKLQIIIISDGSTDGTKRIIQGKADSIVDFVELPDRSGKNVALNAGLKEAGKEIVVFTDASIMLDRNALKNIVRNFRNEEIGCVSGEDHIPDGGGEGFYGKYELYLRNQESKVYSIVGASGSFYAQRRHLCVPFEEGTAPDFVSVLETVEKGYRAVTDPSAYGTMTSLKGTKDEFGRKVRTLIRGMTALFNRKHLLNPWEFGLFSFELISHKIMRWLVPVFLVLALVSNVFLVSEGRYLALFILQSLFYLTALCSVFKYRNIHERIYGKIPLYFTTVNAAILYAWFKYLSGVRQEIWSPSKR